MAIAQPDRPAASVPSSSDPFRPRVAYLITNSEIGGAQSHVADLLKAFEGRVDATLLAGGEGPLFAAAAAAGARTIRLSLLDNALSPWRAIATLRQVVRGLREARPDLIHVHSAKAGALGRLAARWLGVPVIYTVHGFAFKPAAAAHRRTASRVAEWLLAPLTTRLVCVSEAEQRLAGQLPVGAGRISVIRNGIADTPLRAAPAEPLRRIVMVARFAAPKRPDTLIHAFASAGLSDCELVIAGDGPDRAAMRALADQLAPGRVSLPGNTDDIAALLASAQIFVLASDHEGLPLSVLEAMRAGLPVVATDLPGVREQLGPERADTLVPAGDADALATMLAALAAAPDRRQTLGRANRERWQRAFGLESMATATWALYQDVLRDAAGTRGLQSGKAQA